MSTPEDIYHDIAAGQPLISAREMVKGPPFCVDGRASHISTAYRAIDPGWKASDGTRIKLESVPARADERPPPEACAGSCSG